VLPGAPATIDNDVDPVPGSIGCSIVERAMETWTEVGDGRTFPIEDRQVDEHCAETHRRSEGGRADTARFCSPSCATGHATIQDGVALPARM
jgi:hypothetical protein